MSYKTFIKRMLSTIFPHKEPSPWFSPFVEDTWLERNMQEPFLKDILWNKR